MVNFIHIKTPGSIPAGVSVRNMPCSSQSGGNSTIIDYFSKRGKIWNMGLWEVVIWADPTIQTEDFGEPLNK